MVGEGSEEVHGAGPIARVNRRELSSFPSKCCNRVDVISIVSTVVCDSYTRPRVPSRARARTSRTSLLLVAVAPLLIHHFAQIAASRPVYSPIAPIT